MSTEDIDALLNELTASPQNGRQSSPASRPASMVSTGPGPQMVQGSRTNSMASTGPGPGFVPHGSPQSRPQSVVSTGPGIVSTGPGIVSTGPGPQVVHGSRPQSMASTGPGPGFVSTGPGIARGGVSTGPGANFVRPQPRGRGGGGLQGVATHTPDGKAITVNSKICDYCQQPIVGRITTAMGNNYHPDHFVCSNCSQPFTDGKYLEMEGKPYCEPHYYELFGPRCHRCEQPIKDKLVRALDKTWHGEHFTCTGCGCSLVGKVYKEAAGEPYCVSCKKNLTIAIDAALHLCAECKRPIMGEYILLAGQYLHPEHFACNLCGKFLQHGDTYEFQGKRYCKEDYDKLRTDVCAGCRKPITGRSMSAMGRQWHPEHFCCTHCQEPLSDTGFYEKNGLPYCGPHYTELYGQACAKCGKQAVGGMNVMGKVYHKACFMCSGCGDPLEGQVVAGMEGKPYCKRCYLKLPKDARKKTEAKEKAEREMQAKKNKEMEKDIKQYEKEANKRSKEARKESKKNPNKDFY